MEIKNYNFHCPHCDQKLSNEGVIRLNTLRNNGEKGEIQLSTSFGNYSYSHEPKIQFIPGEIVSFSCPDCNKDVHSDQYENFALLKMKVSDNIDFDVLFSREAGKRKTYVLTEDGIESYSEK